MVFESLVERVLKLFLGKYVDGLDTKNLRMGVWAGNLVLENLVLKPGALDELRLPVNVTHGYLRELKIQLPGWTPSKLSSEPVAVTIDGLYVIAEPQSGTAETLGVDLEAQKRQKLAIKRSKLIQAEVLEKSLAKESGDGDDEESLQKDTFLERLFTTVIRNLQVTIRNVHIRYEDRVTVPSHPFAFGVTIAELSAHTTDANGNIKFVTPEQNSGGVISHKLVQLDSLSIYFNTRLAPADLWSTMGPEALHSKLRNIPSSSSSLSSSSAPDPDPDPAHLNFVLHPLSVSLRLIMNTFSAANVHSKAAARLPKYDVSVAVGDLKLELSRDQFDSARLLLDHFSTVQLKASVALVFARYRELRPEESPREAPARWWNYAIRCVIGVNRRHRSPPVTWQSITNHIRDRQRYAELWKRHIAAEKKCDWLTPLSDEEQRIRDTMEQRLDFEHIVVFRSVARAEFSAEFEKKKALEKQKLDAQQDKENGGDGSAQSAPNDGGWWGYVWGSSWTAAPGDEKDELVVPSLSEAERKALFQTIDWDETAKKVVLPEDYVSTKFNLQMDYAALSLREGSTQLLSGTLSGSLEVHQRPSSRLARVVVSTLEIDDTSTSDTQFPRIMFREGVAPLEPPSATDTDSPPAACEKDDAAASPSFVTLEVEENPLNSKADFRVDVSIEPVETVFCPRFVTRLFRFFSPSTGGPSLFATAWKERRQAELLEALTHHRVVDLSVVVKHPVLLVPEDVCDRNTKLLVGAMRGFEVRSAGTKALVKSLKSDSTNVEHLYPEHPENYDAFELSLKGLRVGACESLTRWREISSSRFVEDKESLENTISGIHKILRDFDLNFALFSCLKRKQAKFTKLLVDGSLPAFHLEVTSSALSTLAKIQKQIVKSTMDADSEGIGAIDGIAPLSLERAESLIDEATVHVDPLPQSEAVSSFELAFAVGDFSMSVVSDESSQDGAVPGSLHPILNISIRQLAMRSAKKRREVKSTVTLRSIALRDLHQQSGPEFEYLALSRAFESNKSSAEDHLITLQLTQYVRQSTATQGPQPDKLHLDINSLDVQWNPETVVLLLDFIRSYHAQTKVENASLASDEAGSSTNSERAVDSNLPRVASEGDFSGEDLTSVEITASLKSLSVTLNKELEHRKLVRGVMSDSRISVTVHKSSAFECHGVLGDLKLTDLTGLHPSEIPSPGICISEEDVTIVKSPEQSHREFFGLRQTTDSNVLTFDFNKLRKDKAAKAGYSSSIGIKMNSVRLVYLQQYILELVDYLQSGLLGSLVKQGSAVVAGQIVRQMGSKYNKLDIDIANPRLILPRHRVSPDFLEADLGRIIVSNVNLGVLDGGCRFEKIQVDASYMSLSSNLVQGHAVQNLALRIDVTRPLDDYSGDPCYKVECSSPMLRLNMSWLEYALINGLLQDNLGAPGPPPLDDANAQESSVVYQFSQAPAEESVPLSYILSFSVPKVELILVRSSFMPDAKEFALHSPSPTPSDLLQPSQVVIDSLSPPTRHRSQSAASARSQEVWDLQPDSSLGFFEGGRAASSSDSSLPLASLALSSFEFAWHKTQDDSRKMRLAVGAVNVSDCREESLSVHRQILCPADNVSDDILYASAESNRANPPTKQLELSYNISPEGKQSVSTTVQQPTGFYVPDFFTDLLAFVFSGMDAANATSFGHDAELGGGALLEASEELDAPAMQIDAELNKATFVLLSDVRDATCPSIVATFGAHYKYTRDGEPTDLRQTTEVQVKALQLFEALADNPGISSSVSLLSSVSLVSPCDLSFTQLRSDTPLKITRDFKVDVDPVKVFVNKRSVKLCAKVLKELTHKEPRKRKVKRRHVKLARVPRSAHSSPRTFVGRKGLQADRRTDQMSQSLLLPPYAHMGGHSRTRSVSTSLPQATSPRSPSYSYESTPKMRRRKELPPVPMEDSLQASCPGLTLLVQRENLKAAAKRQRASTSASPVHSLQRSQRARVGSFSSLNRAATNSRAVVFRLAMQNFKLTRRSDDNEAVSEVLLELLAWYEPPSSSSSHPRSENFVRPWPFRVTVKERQGLGGGGGGASASATVVPPLDLGPSVDAMFLDLGETNPPPADVDLERSEPPTQVDIHAVKTLDVDLNDEILRDIMFTAAHWSGEPKRKLRPSPSTSPSLSASQEPPQDFMSLRLQFVVPKIELNLSRSGAHEDELSFPLIHLTTEGFNSTYTAFPECYRFECALKHLHIRDLMQPSGGNFDFLVTSSPTTTCPVVADLYSHLRQAAPISAELPPRQPSRSLFDALSSPRASSRAPEIPVTAEVSHDDLISVAYTHSLVGKSTDTLDVDFNVLHIEFNPETILQLVEFVKMLSATKVPRSSQTPLVSPISRSGVRGFSKTPNSFENVFHEANTPPPQSPTPEVEDTTSESEALNPEDLKSDESESDSEPDEDYVQVRISARLQRLSMSLNKETENRKLVLVDMGASTLNYEVNKLGTYSASGALGRFHISDISDWKNLKFANAERVLASALSQQRGSEKGDNKQAAKATRVDYCRKMLGLRDLNDGSVLKFGMSTYPEATEETGGAFGLLRLQLNSIELIYHQQFIMELVDYMSQGILGSLFATAPTETALPASPVLHTPRESLKKRKRGSKPEDPAFLRIEVDVKNPLLILPKNRADESQFLQLDLGRITAHTTKSFDPKASPENNRKTFPLWIETVAVHASKMSITCSPPLASASDDRKETSSLRSSKSSHAFSLPPPRQSCDIMGDTDLQLTSVRPIGDLSPGAVPFVTLGTEISSMQLSLTKEQYDLILDIFYDNILAPNPYEKPKPSRTNRKASARRFSGSHSPILQSQVSPQGASRLWDTSSGSGLSSSPRTSLSASTGSGSGLSTQRPPPAAAATLRNLRPRTGSFHKSTTSPRQSLTRKQLAAADFKQPPAPPHAELSRPSLQRPLSSRTHSPHSDPSGRSGRPRTIDRIKYAYTDFYGQLSSLNFSFEFGKLSLVCKHRPGAATLPQRAAELDFAAVALSNLVVEFSRDQLQRSCTSLSVQTITIEDLQAADDERPFRMVFSPHIAQSHVKARPSTASASASTCGGGSGSIFSPLSPRGGASVDSMSLRERRLMSAAAGSGGDSKVEEPLPLPLPLSLAVPDGALDDVPQLRYKLVTFQGKSKTSLDLISPCLVYIPSFWTQMIAFFAINRPPADKPPRQPEDEWDMDSDKYFASSFSEAHENDPTDVWEINLAKATVMLLVDSGVSDTPALISKLDFTYKFDSRWVHESLVPGGGARNRDRKRETSSVDVAQLTLFASQADKVTLDDDVSHSIVDPCDITFSMRKEKNFGERAADTRNTREVRCKINQIDVWFTLEDFELLQAIFKTFQEKHDVQEPPSSPSKASSPSATSGVMSTPISPTLTPTSSSASGSRSSATVSASASPSSATAAASPSLLSDMRESYFELDAKSDSEEWTCDRCTFLNKSFKTRCEMCNAERSVATTPSSTRSPRDPSHRGDRRPSRVRRSDTDFVSFELVGVNVVLVNDYRGRYMPLTDLMCQDLTIVKNGTGHKSKTVAKVDLEIRYYNPQVLFWEPLLEPCTFDMLYEKNQPRVLIAPEVKADDFSPPSSDEIPSTIDLRLQGRSPVSVSAPPRSPHLGANSAPPGRASPSSGPIDNLRHQLKHSRSMTALMSNVNKAKKEKRERSRAMENAASKAELPVDITVSAAFVSSCLDTMASWSDRSERAKRNDRVFSPFRIANDSGLDLFYWINTDDSGKLKGLKNGEEKMFEVERFGKNKKRSQKHSKSEHQFHLSLQIGADFAPIEGLTVTKTRCFHEPVYSVRGGAVSRVLIDTRLHSGRKTIYIRSPVSIRNVTEVPLMARISPSAVTDTQSRFEYIGPIFPRESKPVPLDIVQWQFIAVRPAHPDELAEHYKKQRAARESAADGDAVTDMSPVSSEEKSNPSSPERGSMSPSASDEDDTPDWPAREFFWSDAVSLKNLATRHGSYRSAQLQCTSSVSGNLYCATARYVVGASKSDHSYIMLYPPLLIYNLFHAPIDYRLANRDNSFLVATGQIEPSDALQIDSLHVASKHILMFKVPNYGWSKWLPIYSTQRAVVRRRPLIKSEGGDGVMNVVLEMYNPVQTPRNPSKGFKQDRLRQIRAGCEVLLYCKYRLINRSQLSLYYMSSGKLLPAQQRTKVLVLWQSFRMGTGSQWRKPFQSSDFPYWGDINGNYRSPDDVSLPSRQWRWSSDWRADAASSDVDANGYMYATAFDGQWHNKQRKNDFVRRRRWVRVCETISQDNYSHIQLYGGETEDNVADNLRIKIADSTWSDSFHPEKAADGILTVRDRRPRGRRYDLAVRFTRDRNRYRTKNIFLEPRYVVRSECSSTTLFIRQAGSTAHPVILVPLQSGSATGNGSDKDGGVGASPSTSGSQEASEKESGSFEGLGLPFQWDDHSLNRLVTVSHNEREWSGAFSIDEVRSFSCMVSNNFILRVQIFLIKGTLVVAFSDEPEDFPSYRIENRSPFTVKYRQKIQADARCRYPVNTLAPKHKAIFAWEELTGAKPYYLNVVVRDEVCAVPLDSYFWERTRKIRGKLINFRIKADGPTKVLVITSKRHAHDTLDQKEVVRTQVNVQLPRLGISIVDHVPRELLYITLKRPHAEIQIGTLFSKIVCVVPDIQVDNQTYPAVYPVLFHSLAAAGDQASAGKPLLHFEAQRSTHMSDVHYFKYLGVLVQEFAVQTTQAFVQDVTNMARASTSSGSSSASVSNGNGSGLRGRRRGDDDVSFSDRLMETEADRTLIFFDTLELQPMAARVSYTRSPEMQSAGDDGDAVDTVMRTLQNMTTSIDKARIKVRGQRWDEVLVTTPELWQRLSSSYRKALLSEAFKFVGSSRLIGNPLGLVNTISDGIHDFWAEPAKGMVKGPLEFSGGVAKGTYSLTRSMVTGLTSSVSGITEALSEGLATLSADDDYLKKRATRQARDKPDDVIDGIVTGATRFGHGFAAAAAGLVKNPVRGAREGGIGGFFKGVGQAAVGVVVKPLAGAAGAVSAMAGSVGETLPELGTKKVSRVRASRMFYGDDKLLKPYDALDAEKLEMYREMRDDSL